MAKYKMRTAKKSKSGNFTTKWSEAIKLTVIANNEKEAFEKARKHLKSEDAGWYWDFEIDDIEID